LSCKGNWSGDTNLRKTKIIIRFKCWICNTDLESNENAIGQRQVCPRCRTPNLVPKPVEAESAKESELCYFCKQKPALPELASIVKVTQYIDKMPYHCRNCGTNWDEPLEKKVVDNKSSYTPQCPSCSCRREYNATPLQLPSMPVGRYASFYCDDKGQNSFCIKLIGYMGFLRCRKCKTIHKIVKRVSWALAIIIAYITPVALAIVTTKDPRYSSQPHRERLFQFMSMVIFSFLILGIPVMYLSRFVIRFVIGRGTLPEKAAKAALSVRQLREKGWTHIEMDADEYNIIRPRLTHKDE